jgi:hypothetical protein
MLYTTAPYFILCDEARTRGDVVKLGRPGPKEWVLQVVAAPRNSTEPWRAAAILFHDLLELDHHSNHLLAWLRGLVTSPDGDDARVDQGGEEA